jgi:hypothetical protein
MQNLGNMDGFNTGGLSAKNLGKFIFYTEKVIIQSIRGLLL